VTKRIEEMLGRVPGGTTPGAGEWCFAEEPAVTLLVEVGQGLLPLAHVVRCAIRGEIAEIATTRELHLFPIDRLVGLRVATPPSGHGGGKRAGFM